MLTFRQAGANDAAVLAQMNHQLIQDEGHRNRMSVSELETRLRNWLKADYRAVLFEQAGTVVAYALYRREDDAVYLRQFFVRRDRRRVGLGRAAMQMLLADVLGDARRVYLDVLVNNASGRAFWKAVGFGDYAMTMEIVRSTRSPSPTPP